MSRFELGIVLPSMQSGPEWTTARWPEMRAHAIRAEQIGFDTLWIADELLWRMEALEALAPVVEAIRTDAEGR